MTNNLYIVDIQTYNGMHFIFLIFQLILVQNTFFFSNDFYMSKSHIADTVIWRLSVCQEVTVLVDCVLKQTAYQSIGELLCGCEVHFGLIRGV